MPDWRRRWLGLKPLAEVSQHAGYNRIDPAPEMARRIALFSIEQGELLALIARLPPDHRRITHAHSPQHGIIIRSSPRGVFQHHRPKVDITSSPSVIGLCRWIDVQASTSEPYHARHHRSCYSCSERENGGALEPPPTFCKTVQSKDSRRKIKQQRHQKQRPQELINLRHCHRHSPDSCRVVRQFARFRRFRQSCAVGAGCRWGRNEPASCRALKIAEFSVIEAQLSREFGSDA